MLEVRHPICRNYHGLSASSIVYSPNVAPTFFDVLWKMASVVSAVWCSRMHVSSKPAPRISLAELPPSTPNHLPWKDKLTVVKSREVGEVIRTTPWSTANVEMFRSSGSSQLRDGLITVEGSATAMLCYLAWRVVMPKSMMELCPVPKISWINRTIRICRFIIGQSARFCASLYAVDILFSC